eukprot:5849310-Pyramimonas_sp.AAC.1
MFRRRWPARPKVILFKKVWNPRASGPLKQRTSAPYRSDAITTAEANWPRSHMEMPIRGS